MWSSMFRTPDKRISVSYFVYFCHKQSYAARRLNGSNVFQYNASMLAYGSPSVATIHPIGRCDDHEEIGTKTYYSRLPLRERTHQGCDLLLVSTSGKAIAGSCRRARVALRSWALLWKRNPTRLPRRFTRSQIFHSPCYYRLRKPRATLRRPEPQ